ncbi:MAG: hypothetical protein ACRENE_07620 [Polyangiaceae bacterium]
MLDLFSPLPPAARAENRRAYRSFLADRDGKIDVARRTLSRREERMARHLRPMPRTRPLDRVLFERQYRSFDPQVETPEEMVLLLALVKTNAAEAYGVERAFDRVYRRSVREHDDLELVLLIEESYHTKILLSSSNLYGLEVKAPFTPRAALRALIGGIADMPEFVARPITLAAEVLGTLTFLSLLGAAGRVLKDDPELRDEVEERIIEILVDEIGHVSFNRTCLGSAGLAQAQMLLPLIARGLKDTIVEMGALGAGITPDPAMLVGPRSLLPEAVRATAFLA